ncbi:MAG TPA: LysM peptidoglycan-binding domain-containing protein [Aquificaceae bacterium]|nr:LysM peptidoglycan-binding domain-containing protein [Aquificaceae bacterium]
MSLLLAFLLSISLLGGEVFAAKCRSYHRVKPGDTLWDIAKKYRLSVKDLLRANPDLKKRKYLRVGKRLCVPYGRKRVRSYILYRVRPGDSLQKIAKRFGVSWREIKRINGLRSNVIRVGQKLKIPKKRGRTFSKRDVVYIKYRVRRGDSLIKIAKRFGVSWREIKRANGLRSNVIRRGQLLRVPVPKTVFEKRYVSKPRINLSFLPAQGKYERVSRGINIFAPCGERVRAVDSGRVIYSGDDLTPYGNMIIVEHPGYLSIYAYNMENLVRRGERVSKGEVIAKVGVKPGSGRCVLHFEVRTKDGAVLNPLEYLGKK